jgi:hypothetical protein
MPLTGGMRGGWVGWGPTALRGDGTHTLANIIPLGNRGRAPTPCQFLQQFMTVEKALLVFGLLSTVLPDGILSMAAPSCSNELLPCFAHVNRC